VEGGAVKIIGRGLTASVLLPYQDKLDDVVFFASGVADSTIDNPGQFQREYELLYETLESCLRTGQRIVYFSSGGAIYGQYEGLRSEATPLFPVTAYGRHKLLCEAIVRESTLTYLIVRLPNLVGARQNKIQLIPALVHQVLRGEVTVYQHAVRDLLDAEDFATVLIRLLETVQSSETIVLASGFAVPVPQMVDVIQQALGSSACVNSVPKGDRQAFDVSKLNRLLDGQLPFHPDYYKQVLLKYATTLARYLP
jgi:NDP-hexose 4-ketoreductase